MWPFRSQLCDLTRQKATWAAPATQGPWGQELCERQSFSQPMAWGHPGSPSSWIHGPLSTQQQVTFQGPCLSP